MAQSESDTLELGTSEEEVYLGVAKLSDVRGRGPRGGE